MYALYWNTLLQFGHPLTFMLEIADRNNVACRTENVWIIWIVGES